MNGPAETVPAARLYCYSVAYIRDTWDDHPTAAGLHLRAVWERATACGFSGGAFPATPAIQPTGLTRAGGPQADELALWTVHDLVVLGVRLRGDGPADAVATALAQWTDLRGADATGLLHELVLVVRADVEPPASGARHDVGRWIGSTLPAELVAPGTYWSAATVTPSNVWIFDASRAPGGSGRCVVLVAPKADGDGDAAVLAAIDDLAWFGRAPGDLALYAATSAKLAAFQRESVGLLAALEDRATRIDQARVAFGVQWADLRARRESHLLRSREVDDLLRVQIAAEADHLTSPVQAGRYDIVRFEENVHELGLNMARQRRLLAQALGAAPFEDDQIEHEVLAGNVAHGWGRLRRSIDLLEDTNRLRTAEVERLELSLARTRARLEQVQASAIGALALGLGALQALSRDVRGAWALILGAIGWVVPLLVIDLEEPYGPGHTLALGIAVSVIAGAAAGLVTDSPAVGGGVGAVIGVVTLALVLAFGVRLSRSLYAALRTVGGWWRRRFASSP